MVSKFIATLLITLSITNIGFSMEGEKTEDNNSPKQSPKPFKKANSAQSVREKEQNTARQNLRDSFKKAHSANALLGIEIIHYDSPCGSGRRRSATDGEQYVPAPEKPDLRDLPPSSKK